MSEDSYTLKEMLTEMKLDMREHGERTARMEETLLAVLEQAKKTNGRVTALEGVNENRKGALSIVRYIGLFATGILVAYLGWLGTEINSINKTLTAYEITVE